MSKRSREKQAVPARREEIVGEISSCTDFAGDFTVFVGLEGIGTDVNTNQDNSERYAEATKRAIRGLYPELHAQIVSQAAKK